MGLKEQREVLEKQRKDVDRNEAATMEKKEQFEYERQEHMKHLDF